MNRITEIFHDKKALITFVTGGDPHVAMTEQLILTMAAAGADLIEIGIPFSDPVAEGPVIQAADLRALTAGCTVDRLFDMVKHVRQKTNIPLVFMSYVNPIYKYGTDRFLQRCADSGIDGVIVPDVPWEEQEELRPLCHKHQITLISMLAPTSIGRIQQIATQAEGFLYCVSSLGVTGMRTSIDMSITKIPATVKQFTNLPCALGFGISSPEQVRQFSPHFDGIIVGSAIVNLVEQYGENALQPVADFTTSLKQALLT